MKISIFNLLTFLSIFFICQNLRAQQLTISLTGQTGSSGTNWSITGNTLSVTGTANIRASVISNHLTTTGSLTVQGTSALAVTVNEAINVASGGNNLVFGTDGNTGSIIVNQALILDGSISVYGGELIINETINTSTGGADGDVLFKSTGDIVLEVGKSITTNGGDVILWANSDGGITNGGVFFDQSSSITSGGGHIWIGGGIGSTSWNGLTVGNGYAVSGRLLVNDFAVRGASKIDIDGGVLLNETSLNSSGGNIYIAGQRNTRNNHDFGAGIINYSGTAGTTINAGSGTIEIVASGNYSGHVTAGMHTGIHPTQVSGGLTLVTGNTTETNAISIIASTLSTVGSGIQVEGNTQILSTAATEGGGISINASSAAGTGWGTWVQVGSLNVLSASGAISLNTGNSGLGLHPNTPIAAATGFLFLGSKTGTSITSSSANLTLTANRIVTNTGSSMNVASSGTLTVESATASFSQTVSTNSQWVLGADLAGLTIGKVGNTATITIGSAQTIAGPISIYGGDIDINENINTTAGGEDGDILIKSSANIVLAGGKSLTTDGGDVVFWANSDGQTADGCAFFKSGSAVSTSGGHIWIGGGSGNVTWNGLTVGNGWAVSGRSISDMGYNQPGDWQSGVAFNRTTLQSSGGHIYVAGQRNVNRTDQVGAGVINYSGTGTLIDAGSGTVVIKGDNTADGNGVFGLMTGLHPNQYSGSFTVKSNSTDAQAISLVGTSNAGIGDGFLVESRTRLLSTASTNGGGISINCTASGNRNAISVGIGFNSGTLEVLSASGDIDINVGTYPLLIANLGVFRLGSISGDADVSNSTANITFTSNNPAWTGNVPIRSTGTLMVTPTENGSFSSTFNTSSLNYTGITGLTIGNASNTAGVTIGSATAIAGSISVYGGTITLDANLTTTNDGDISFYTDNAIGGLSTARNVTAAGEFRYVPRTNSFASAVSFPFTNLILSSNGLLIGKSTNTANLTFANNTTINGPITVYAGTITLNANLTSTSGDITLFSDNPLGGLTATRNVTAAGSFNYIPRNDNYTTTVTFPITNLSLVSTGLQIGKLNNTSGVTIGNNTSINGPVTVFGGDIAIQASLTAIASDINLHASGTVSQSAAITANQLGLHGEGDFILTHPENIIGTIAGGSEEAPLGSLRFTNAEALIIGSVNPIGITASGDIVIETVSGDIELTEPVVSSSTTSDINGYAGAIVLNAGKGSEINTPTGGNILVSGFGDVTASMGIVKLYSGYPEGSTGLTDLAGGEENTRLMVDETTENFNPELESPGVYAFYRAEGLCTTGEPSDEPTVCIAVAITDITIATTDVTGIDMAEGLPAGLSASWADNLITISGTPTATGVFNYSIPLQGECGGLEATGTITVNGENTVDEASATPTLCINTSLTDITHTTTGATGIGTAVGLPTGVTASWAGNLITISGIPTASGTFEYSIPLTGGCGTVEATGTITVTAENTADEPSSDPTLCVDSELTDITIVTTGATGIGTATDLPAGLTAVWADNLITISGTPTASGTFDYSIPMEGGCGSIHAEGTITVSASNTVANASSTESLCIDTELTDITHATTGATGIGTAIGLPAGVTASWAADELTISGTPTESGTFSYTIPLIGGCGSVNATGNITVNAQPQATITVSENSGTTENDGTICAGASVFLSAGGGATYNWGTSTEALTVVEPLSTTVYSVTVSSSEGCTATTTTTITVDALPAPTISKQDPDCPLAITGTASSSTEPGWTYLWSTGATTSGITGLSQGLYTLSVTDGNNCVGNASVTLVDPFDMTISVSKTDVTCHQGSDGGISITVNGGQSPYTYNWSNGADTDMISGLTAGNYSVTVTEGGQFACRAVSSIDIEEPAYGVTASINISESSGLVSDDGTICDGDQAVLTVSAVGSPGTTIQGYVWDNDSGSTLNVNAGGTYTVTITDSDGCTGTASAMITVTPTNTVGEASSTPSLCVNTMLTPITHTTTGVTGIGTPVGLPGGVTATWSGDELTISGTPNLSGVYAYSIPLIGGCGMATATGTITVFDEFDAGAIATTGETICYGGTPQQTIGSSTAAIGGDGNITYSWRSSANNYTAAISGATGSTFTPPAGLTGTTKYRRYAVDGTCNTTATVSTGEWTVTVRPEFSAGAIATTGETICNGGAPGPIGSSAAASGGDGTITYSWRSSADNYGADINGATGSTFTPPAGLTSTTTYRRYAKDGTCNTTEEQSTGEWTVTLRPDFNAGAIATTGETICYGGTPASIGSTTAASGGDGNITYSWRSSADNYTAAINGATGSTFTPPAGLTSTTTYRRYAVNGTCNTTAQQSTGEWTVTVRPQFITGAIATTGETICYGGTPQQTIGSITPMGGGDGNDKYSWRSSADNYTAAISGATGPTFTPPAGLTVTTSYRRYAADETCNTTATASTGEWTVTVRPEFSAGAIATTGETVCNGGAPGPIGSSTAASGGDGTVTYSWRSSVDNYTANIPGANGAGYTPPAGLTVTTSYRRYAKDNTCNTTAEVSTGTWTVTVQSSPTITCPAPLLVNTSTDGTGDCLGTASWQHPALGAGSCAPVTLTMSIDGGTGLVVMPETAYSQQMAPGNYVVSYLLQDGGGNTASCSFPVSVMDDEDPIINCRTSASVTLNGQASTTLQLSDLATVSDNCAGLNTVLIPATLSAAQLGTTPPVQVIATDAAGNMSACVVPVSIGGLPAGWSFSSVSGNNGGGGSGGGSGGGGSGGGGGAGGSGDCNSDLAYNPATGVWTATSSNCNNNSPFQRDAMMFARRQLCGDGSITAQITSFSGAPVFAGIVMRETTAEDAKKVQMMINGTSSTLRREIRYTTGGQAFPSMMSSPLSRNWLRIVRTGNSFRGYTSADGLTWWYVMQVQVPMNSCIDMGLVLINGLPNQAGTATYANISVTGVGSGPVQVGSGMVADIAPEEGLDVQVYPNPGDGLVQVSTRGYVGQGMRWEVYDQGGRRVWQRETGSHEEMLGEIDLRGIPSGVYALRVQLEDGKVITRRILIQQR